MPTYMTNSTASSLDFIQLHNEVRLGVFLGSPVVVFNLPKIEGLLSDRGRLFEVTDPGPSEVHAEEIAALVESKLGRNLDPGELIACRFDQNGLGQVKNDYVVQWLFDGGFHTRRARADDPSVQKVRDLLLLNDASTESMVSPLMKTRSFSDNGHLYGQVMDTGYSGMLHFNGVNVPVSDRDELVRLSQAASYEEISGFCYLAFPGCGLSLSKKDAEALQTAARDAHDEVLLHIQKQGPVRRLDPAMPELSAFLLRAVESQVSIVNRQNEEAPAFLRDLRDSSDDLGRAKTVIETVVLGAGNPLVAGAVLVGAYVAQAFLAASRSRKEKRSDSETG